MIVPVVIDTPTGLVVVLLARVPERIVSHPLPILMAVSAVLAPFVICEILTPFNVPALIPVATILTPLLVKVASGLVVTVLTVRPLQVQVPPVQAVILGAATLMALVALVPAPAELLIVEETFKPLVVELPVSLVEALMKEKLTKLLVWLLPGL